jgi:hypothetical protein
MSDVAVQVTIHNVSINGQAHNFDYQVIIFDPAGKPVCGALLVRNERCPATRIRIDLQTLRADWYFSRVSQMGQQR